MFMKEATEIFKLLPNLVIRELFVKVQAIKDICVFENRTFQWLHNDVQHNDIQHKNK
jgi:hypothetical protein